MIQELYVNNINNSLVFYRALMNHMPVILEAEKLVFQMGQDEIILIESPKEQRMAPMIYHVDSRSELHQIYQRVKRFSRTFHQKDCRIIDDRMGIEDPDGHRWIITLDPGSSIKDVSIFTMCQTLPFKQFEQL